MTLSKFTLLLGNVKAGSFGTTPEFWLKMQTTYHLDVLRDKEADKIRREVLPVKAVAAD